MRLAARCRGFTVVTDKQIGVTLAGVGHGARSGVRAIASILTRFRVTRPRPRLGARGAGVLGGADALVCCLILRDATTPILTWLWGTRVDVCKKTVNRTRGHFNTRARSVRDVEERSWPTAKVFNSYLSHRTSRRSLVSS